jgi:hypothetical protein
MRTYAIFLFLFPFTVCQAQQGRIKSGTREVILNSGDSIIVTHVLPEDKRIRTNLSKTYYWYQRGKICHNTGNYSGKLLHGNYNVFLEDILILSGTFNKGLRSGRWITWNNNGNINKIILYQNGNPKIKKEKFINIFKRKVIPNEKNQKIKSRIRVKQDHKRKSQESKTINPEK